MKSVAFLDYVIVVSDDNSDFVLTKPNSNSYEIHLGNYSSLSKAKEAALDYFFISRPEFFASHVYQRLHGSELYCEWFAFKKVCEKESITIPFEICQSVDGNFSVSLALLHSQSLPDGAAVKTFYIKGKENYSFYVSVERDDDETISFDVNVYREDFGGCECDDEYTQTHFENLIKAFHYMDKLVSENPHCNFIRLNDRDNR